MANYLSLFCPQLASMAEPLSELQGATMDWKWTHLYDISFQELKARIMYKEVLQQLDPDLSQRLYLVCDSSDTGIIA